MPLQETKIEGLRQDLIAKSSELFLSSAEKSRQRLSIPHLIFPSESQSNDDGQEVSVKSQFESSAKATVSALSTNAALDREELDILWWVLGDWSNLAKVRLSKVSDCSAFIIATFEIARRLRRIPAEAHRQLLMRYIENDASLSLEDVIDGLGDEANALSAVYGDESLVNNNPRILPLMNAIVNGKETMNGVHMSLSVTDWTTRALIEGALVQLSNLPSELI